MHENQPLTWANQQRQLSELAPWARNPRRISADQARRLNESLLEFAQVETIAIGPNNEIYNGHQRLKAWAEQYGDLKIDVRVSNRALTEKEREKLTIFLHKGAAGEWDFEKLIDFDTQELLEWGFDISELADHGIEISALSDDDEAEQSEIDAEPQIDKAEELRAKWGVEAGQLWNLDTHRLLCGDSTKAEDVARVLGGVVPLLMVTDPPYGVEYDAEWRDHSLGGAPNRAIGKVQNDNRSDWHEAFALFPGDIAYVWHASGQFQEKVLASLVAAGFEARNHIIWAKSHFPIGRGHYHHQHEPCWYAVRKGATAHWAGDRTQTTLWQIDKNQKSETGHSTQKPLECMARPMRNHHAPEVYDPFLGSGTTIIAAEKLNRRCYAIELSPAYVAVALERFFQATGKTPSLL